MSASGRSSTLRQKKYATVLILSEDTTHAVVEFRICGKSSIALIVRTWLTAEKKNWYCQYPKGSEMDCVPQYAQASINPRPDWPKYKVKIVQEAPNYNQGKRRFDRLLDGDNAYISDLLSMDQLPSPEKTDGNIDLGVLDESLDKNRTNDSDTTKSLSEEAGNSDAGIDQQTNDIGIGASDDSTVSRSRSVTPEIRSHKQKNNEKKGTAATHSKNPNSRKPDSNAEGTAATHSKNPNSRKPDSDAGGKAKALVAAERQNSGQPQPNAVSKTEMETEMKKMQEAICKKIETLKKSWISELRHQFQELAASVTPSEKFRAVGEALNTCKKTLDTNFPIEDKQKFLALEAALVTDDEKNKALKTYMQLLQNGSKTTKDSITQILSALLSKCLQLTFSGAGRVTKGVGKDNFSATQMFKAMSELLIEIHSCSCAEVRSKTGKWLAGAGDRNGGKKERDLNRQ